MCTSVLDYKLAKKTDSMLIQFWLFTVRAVDSTNAGLGSLETLFQKYSSYADHKKDYLVSDFLKIVQECVMLNFFSTQEELKAIIDYFHTKFMQEIEIEKLWIHQNQDKENIN